MESFISDFLELPEMKFLIKHWDIMGAIFVGYMIASFIYITRGRK